MIRNPYNIAINLLGISVLILLISIIANVAMFSTINYQDKIIDEYKSYYNASEKLYDEIEEDNDGYFDGDNGCNYLKARRVIKDRNNIIKE